MRLTNPYLVQSAGFAPDQHRNTFGQDRVVVVIAGDNYRFQGLSPSQSAAVIARFKSDMRDPRGPSIEIKIFQAPRSMFHRIETKAWQYDLSFEYTDENVWLAGLGFVARLRRGPNISASLWTCVQGGKEFDGVLENLLRVITAHRLLSRHAVLLHSSAIKLRDQACVFVGRSGAGKSTIAHLAVADGFQVPSDDLNAVFVEPAAAQLCPVPFCGDLQPERITQQPVRLIAVYLLHQASKQRLTPVSPALAMSRLISCCPFVNRDPFCLERLIDILNELTVHCRTARLEFARDEISWDPLLQAA